MKTAFIQKNATKKSVLVFLVVLITSFSIVSCWWATHKSLSNIQAQKQLHLIKANCKTLVLKHENNALNLQQFISASNKRAQRHINKAYTANKSSINSSVKIPGGEFRQPASMWKFGLLPQIPTISNDIKIGLNVSDRIEFIQELNLLCADLGKASDSIDSGIISTLKTNSYMHSSSIVIFLLLGYFIYHYYRNLYSNDFPNNPVGNDARTTETKRNIKPQYISSLNTVHKALTQLVEEPESTEPFALFLDEIEKLTSATSSAIFVSQNPASQLTMLASTDLDDRDWSEIISCKILPKLTSFDATKKTIEVFEEMAQPEYKFLCVRLHQEAHTFSLLVLKISSHIEVTDPTILILLEHSSRLANIVSSVHLARLKLRDAHYEERAVIARELHDSLAQSLSYLKIKASRLQNILTGSDVQACSKSTEIDDMMQDLRANLNIAYHRLRELISTFRLTLGGKKFPQALVDSVEEFAKRSAIAFDIDNRLPTDILSATEEIQLLHIIRESLSNVVRHSQAKFALISIHYNDFGQISIMVEDDGIGLPDMSNPEQHFGIIIMQERAHSIGGNISLSKRKDGGACLRVVFQASKYTNITSNS